MKNKIILIIGTIILVGLVAGFGIIDLEAMAHGDTSINMPHVYLTIAVLICAAFLFFTELLPIAVTAILIPCALSTFGVITVKEAWISFGDTSIMTIVGLFMLGEATFATGFAQKSAAYVISRAGKSETRILVVAIAMIGIMSGFLNNAGVTAITLPMLISIAHKAHLSPSKILLPTAYAASAGGCITLVGTAPNMVANALITQIAPGTRTFGFFEFGYYGVPLLIAIILLYVFFGKWLIPNKGPINEAVDYEGEKEIPYDPKMWIAGGVYFGVIISMATGFIPLTSAAMLGAMLCIITRCMTAEAAFKAVDWATIYIFAGALSLSFAMSKTGAAKIMADYIISVVQDPFEILAITCIITGLVTNVMSNTAATAIMVPLVIPLALDLNLSPLPFVMGICAAASACFLSPIATPSNTMVLKPGHYSFIDYVKYGWSLQLVAFALILILVPMFWPFAIQMAN